MTGNHPDNEQMEKSGRIAKHRPAIDFGFCPLYPTRGYFSGLSPDSVIKSGESGFNTGKHRHNYVISAKKMIRIYQHGDHIAIAEIFARAIHEIASEDYTIEQCLAWSSRNPNPEHWKSRCELKRPFVAIIDSQIAGFLELDTDGHIDCAYVNPDFRRRGVMTRLVTHATNICFAMKLPRVYVEASICAKPLFQSQGFDLLSENFVNIRGVSLVNYRMELQNPNAERIRL